jgi:hypothetical protein
MSGKLRRLVLGTRFFSPGAFLRRAALISLVFLLMHGLGLREHTRVFSGTSPDGASALLGTSYAVIYLGFVIVVPILVIAALLLLGLQQLPGVARPRERSSGR